MCRTIFFLYLLSFFKYISCNNNYEEQYNQLRDQYDEFYNSSFLIYQHCTRNLDECNSQLDNALEENCQEQLLECSVENKDENNHDLLKEIIILESTLQNLNSTCNKRIQVAY